MAFAFAGFSSVVCFALFVWFGDYDSWCERLVASFGLSALCGAIPLAAVLPTCCFSLRFDNEQVTHLFAGRLILSTYPLSELKSVDIARGGWGVCLRFGDTRRIRFLGAHLLKLAELRDFLRATQPAVIVRTGRLP